MRTRRRWGLWRGRAFAAGFLLVVGFAGSVRAAHAAGSPIAEAAQAGDAAKVRELAAHGADVNAPAADGSTALLWAVYNSDLDTVKALLAARAKVDVANGYGVTPLLQASRNGDAASIEALLAAGADVHERHPDGETPLMAASRSGHRDAVEALLKAGADPNADDSFAQQTPLMWAAAEGHFDVVDALLKAGADPNRQAHVDALKTRKNADFPSGGFTALMWAARNGDEKIVRRLVEGGADLKLKNGDGLTATMIAIVNDRLDMAATLIGLGSDPNDGSLFYAVQMRDATTDWYAHDGSYLRPDHANKHTALDLVALLLDKGADPNRPFAGELHWSAMCCDPAENASPFYRAAVEADVEVLRLLLAHGGDVHWTPSKVEAKRAANGNVGKPALVVAVNGGRGVSESGGPGNVREGPPPFREPSDRKPIDAVRLLLKAGADPNAAAPDGTTALHAAAEYRKLDVIRALADAGAKLDASNAAGLTPLDVALGRLGKGEKPKPPPMMPVKETGPTREQVADLLRSLMQARGIPIVLHGSAPPAELASNGQ